MTDEIISEIAKRLKIVNDKLHPELKLSEEWFKKRILTAPKWASVGYCFNTVELTRLINNED